MAATRCSPTKYLAYESLSDGLKKTLDALMGVSSSAKADVARRARMR